MRWTYKCKLYKGKPIKIENHITKYQAQAPNPLTFQLALTAYIQRQITQKITSTNLRKITRVKLTPPQVKKIKNSKAKARNPLS